MIEIKNLSFSYGTEKALDTISLKIKDGEFILLTGGSGSGKTTLVRCLNGLVPNFYGGALIGSVTVNGKDATQTPTKELAKTVGMVFQDPEAMFVSSTVEEEISFGPVCLGYTTKQKKHSVTEALRTLGIESLRKKSLQELSGGEKQRVAIAAVLVTKPKVLILDEPLSEIDHETADNLMDFLKKLNENGVTIILIEQRTERVYDFVKREIVLSKGKVAYDGPPKTNGAAPKCNVTTSGDVLVRLDKVSFGYDKDCYGKDFDEKNIVQNIDNFVFKNFSEEFKEGELVVIEGPNGSGKTTLLKLIMGFLKPVSGKVNVGGIKNPSVEETAGSVGYVFQNPDNHLFAETVEEEVNFILKNTGERWNTDDKDEDNDKKVENILKTFKISKYKKSYPRYLSGGEKQRVALASILVAEPKVLLLDEPTRGMDHELKKELVEYLLHYVNNGNLVIMATHDEFMKGCASRRIVLKL